MISYVLYCILWSKPDVRITETPVSEYGVATMSEQFNQFEFEATVIEEKMNSVKIKHLTSGYESSAYAPNDHTQRSLSIRMEIAADAATLDCEMRQKLPEKK